MVRAVSLVVTVVSIDSFNLYVNDVVTLHNALICLQTTKLGLLGAGPCEGTMAP